MDWAPIAAAAAAALQRGDRAAARQHISSLRSLEFLGDEVLSAVATLAYAAGDAQAALAAVRRMDSLTERACTIALGSAHAIGDKRLIAQAMALRPRTAKDLAYVEDLLTPTTATYRPQQAQKRAWGKVSDEIDFAEFSRRHVAHADELAPSIIGAREIRTRMKMLPLWTGQPVRHLAMPMLAGFGDTFLQGRYARRLGEMAEVTVLCVPEVARIVKQSLPGVAVVSTPEEAAVQLAKADAYAYPWTLGYLTGTGYGAAAWVKPDVFSAAARQPFGERPHVGVCWNGSVSASYDSLRSIPIAEFEPLFGVPGITWHSLQHGPKAAEAPPRIRRHEFRDFHDTAALIAGLDAVVAVDTAVANLAGAMGKPLYVMIERDNDFRWGASSESTRWFPSARVFRQSRAGDWAPVVERVRAALETP